MFTIFSRIATAWALVLAISCLPAFAVDEYGIRCNPGGGELPRDGVICFAFRPGTKASDFDNLGKLGYPSYAYVAANGRGKYFLVWPIIMTKHTLR